MDGEKLVIGDDLKIYPSEVIKDSPCKFVKPKSAEYASEGAIEDVQMSEVS